MKRQKPKTLRASLREKKRYVVVKIDFERVDLEEFWDGLKRKILELFGLVGYANLNPKIIKDIFDGRRVIIRCSHKYVEHLRFALISIDKIKNKSICISCVGVSGTLKGAKRKFFNKI